MTRRAFPSTFVADEMVQFTGIFWNSIDSLQCYKIVAIVTSEFTISLAVQMSLFALFFTKRELTIKQSELLKLGLKTLLTKKKKQKKNMSSTNKIPLSHQAVYIFAKMSTFMMLY